VRRRASFFATAISDISFACHAAEPSALLICGFLIFAAQAAAATPSFFHADMRAALFAAVICHALCRLTRRHDAAAIFIFA